jgi:hypothetical protein
MFRKDYNEVVRCPRCRLDNLPLGYPGALSRADNKTEICSACGTDEAMVNFILKSPAQDPSTWPVKRTVFMHDGM